MKILRKILFLALFACLFVWGSDYGKHAYLLNNIKKENPKLTFEGERVNFRDGFFYIAIDKVHFDQGGCEHVSLRIPFFSFSRVFVRLYDFNALGVYFDKLKGELSKNGKRVHFEELEIRKLGYQIKENYFTAESADSNGEIGPHSANVTLFIRDVRRNGAPLFNFSLVTTLHRLFTEQGNGQVKLRVSNFRKFLDILSHEFDLPALKLPIIEAAFGDNVAVPIDLRGRKFYLGPIKIAELPEITPVSVTG